MRPHGSAGRAPLWPTSTWGGGGRGWGAWLSTSTSVRRSASSAPACQSTQWGRRDRGGIVHKPGWRSSVTTVGSAGRLRPAGRQWPARDVGGEEGVVLRRGALAPGSQHEAAVVRGHDVLQQDAVPLRPHVARPRAARKGPRTGEGHADPKTRHKKKLKLKTTQKNAENTVAFPGRCSFPPPLPATHTLTLTLQTELYSLLSGAAFRSASPGTSQERQRLSK